MFIRKGKQVIIHKTTKFSNVNSFKKSENISNNYIRQSKRKYNNLNTLFKKKRKKTLLQMLKRYKIYSLHL